MINPEVLIDVNVFDVKESGEDWDETKCDIGKNSDEEDIVVDKMNSEVLIDVNVFDVKK